MSILIVEDNAISAKVLEFNLQKNAYQTIVAQSAKEALKHLTTAHQIRLIIAEYQNKIKLKFSPFSRQHSPCIPLSGIFQDFIEPVRTIPASEIRSSA